MCAIIMSHEVDVWNARVIDLDLSIHVLCYVRVHIIMEETLIYFDYLHN